MIELLTRPVRTIGFAAWFAWQIVRSSHAVLVDILTPGSRATPRVVRLPLGHAGPVQIAVISMLITLTPGTLTLGVSHDDGADRAILVHSMYHGDEGAALHDLRDMYGRLRRATSAGGRQ